MIPKSQHFEPPCAKPNIPFRIFLFPSCVLPSIQLDNKLFFKAHEIDYIRPNRLLPSEFYALQLLASQFVP